MHRLYLLLLMAALLAACGGAPETTPVPTAAPTTAAATLAVPTAEPTATTALAETAVPDPTATSTLTATPTATPIPLPVGEVDAVGLELVVDGLAAPIALVAPDDGSGRLFVADQIGLIYVVDADGRRLPEPLLDLRDRMVAINPNYDERGLLGLALHPEFAANGLLFVYYSAPLQAGGPEGWDHTSHVAEFTLAGDNPNQADPASERLLLQVDQPQPNHNGGQIAFGPDGYLYIPLGDGGDADDTGLGHNSDWYDINEGGNGQSLTTLLGKILRLDVDQSGPDGRPYAIPADNPFVGRDVPAEIYAYGFRNPYRIAFDHQGDGALYAADVGQNRWEEVSIVVAGGNYGWNVKEGSRCFSTVNPFEDRASCPGAGPDGKPFVDPIIEYQNGNTGGIGLAVVGGGVYRGAGIPEMVGRYLFADWSTIFGEPDGQLFVATPRLAEDGSLAWSWRTLEVATRRSGRPDAYVLSFGEDAAGEWYVLTTQMPGPTGETGQVLKLVPADGPVAAEPPPTATTPPPTATTPPPTPTTAPTAPPQVVVEMRNVAFAPLEITIRVGTTVVWPNLDGFAHTVTAGTPQNPQPQIFDSGNVDGGGRFRFTFNEPGTYAYYCILHPIMVGTVTVQP